MGIHEHKSRFARTWQRALDPLTRSTASEREDDRPTLKDVWPLALIILGLALTVAWVGLVGWLTVHLIVG